MAQARADIQTLSDRLADIVGDAYVLTDAESRSLYAQDIFTEGAPAFAVVQPGSTAELAAVVAAATGLGHPVIARGGGMSYTSGYVPRDDQAVIIDMLRMNRVVEINRDDMYVTVECGCSWRELHAALDGTGLRTPYWGTLSGIHATVGGGLSQNSIFWGSGRYGSAVDSVIGLTVVLADGSVVSTGAGGQVNGTPFFRHFGPDLTGLFCCDTGALGFKATATLKLIPVHSAQRYLSCEFADAAAMMGAMSEISRKGLAMECFGFDPFLTAQRLQRESLMNDVKALAGVMKASGSVLGALKDGAKVALAGRRFLDQASYSLHLMFEEDCEQLADTRLAAAREIVAAAGGSEIENSIPKILRANPFTPLNNVVGPRGERWGPIHVLVPHSKAAAMHDAINAVLETHSALTELHGIGVGFLYATVGHSSFVLEPVFYWPDAMTEIHRRTVEPAVLEKLPGFEADADARAAVEAIRRDFLAAFKATGGVHMQIGKTYPYIDGIHPEAKALVEALKAAVDPNGLVNPGTLGLG